jgi:hypothetical protein
LSVVSCQLSVAKEYFSPLLPLAFSLLPLASSLINNNS